MSSSLPVEVSSSCTFSTVVNQAFAVIQSEIHRQTEWIHHVVTESIPTFCKQVGPLALEKMKMFREGIDLLDRTFTHYCDTHLPHPLNVITKAAFGALPFIVLQACLPTPLYIASLVAIIAYDMLTKNPDEPSSLVKTLPNAFAFRSFFLAGVSGAAFVQTGAIPSLLWTITNITLGILASLRTHLAQDIFNFSTPAEEEVVPC
jgi:hypothetical protein